MIPPPRLRRLKLAILALVATLVAAGWVASRDPRAISSGAPRPPSVIPLTDVHPWGANFFLQEEPDAWNRRKTVEEASAAGIRYAKQHFPWFDLEPEPGEWAWRKYDEIVDHFVSSNIEVIARLDFPPAWVAPAAGITPEKVGPPNNTPPADLDAYAEYAAAVAGHFKGRVRFYQIWNEPNLRAEWGWRTVDAEEYASMLEAAATAIRAVDPDAVILSAPLAVNNETLELEGNQSDLRYLEALYDAGVAKHFDVLSANAFGFDRPPDDPAEASTLNFQRMTLQRDIMRARGDDCKATWASEFGWNASPPGLFSIWPPVSEEVQARWTVEAVRLARERWDWAGVFNIWYFRHCCQSRDDPVYHFQMVDEDFNRRRLFASVAQASAETSLATPGHWSERSAPVRLRSNVEWAWRWDRPDEPGDACRSSLLPEPDHALDQRYISSDVPGAGLSFDFEGTALAVRVVYGPQAGTLRWSVDGEEDERVVLKKADTGWDWLELAAGLSPGRHRLEISVGDAGGSVAIDGFRVGADPDADPRKRWLALLGVVGLVLGAMVYLDMRLVVSRLRSV